MVGMDTLYERINSLYIHPTYNHGGGDTESKIESIWAEIKINIKKTHTSSHDLMSWTIRAPLYVIIFYLKQNYMIMNMGIFMAIK